MIVTGIVAEFNPFHNGHAHLIREARRITQCDYVIVVMSGNFVQDGTPAITDKYVRTEMCLCGADAADMVFEIPTVYATASAEGFAHAAIELLHSLGVVNYLCFGSEACNVSLMQELATLYLTEPDAYRLSLQEHLKEGKSFPKARQDATLQYLLSNTDRDPHTFDEIKTLLEAPNAVLGIEYCKAILQLGADMTPIALPRHLTEHHDIAPVISNGSELCDPTDFASATTIRGLLLEASKQHRGWNTDFTQGLRFCPGDTQAVLRDALLQTAPISPESLLPHLQKKCLELSFSTLPDACPDLLRILQREALSCKETDYISWIMHFKHKGLTQTHVQRFVLHLLWDALWQEPTPPNYPIYYLRLLGFRKETTDALRKALRHATLPIITKVADHKTILSTLPDTVQEAALKQFQLDLYSSQFYYLLQESQTNEYTHGPVIV